MNRRERGKRTATHHSSLNAFLAWPDVLISAGAFIATLIVLFVMLFRADVLVNLGLIGNLYFVVLAVLGLTVASFLFGVFRSRARYSGKTELGTLELGGPVVIFVLVLVLGFELVPNPTPFTLTIFVRTTQKQKEPILHGHGNILLDLGGDRRREAIGDKGQAVFASIPATFRGQEVPVSLEADGYELALKQPVLRISGESAYLPVRRTPVELSGTVRSESGQPVAGAHVQVGSISATSDAAGYFRLTIVDAGNKQSWQLQVQSSDFAAWHGEVVAGGSDIAVVLAPQTRISPAE